jgi:gluconokinase
LRAEAGEVRFIFLKGTRALIAERLATRSEHFMPQSLLDSQFAALEKPGPDERVWECDVRESPADIVAALVARAST